MSYPALRILAFSGFLLVPLCTTGTQATSINKTNKYTWGSNIGWANWQGDMTNGAEVGSFFCKGYIWDANTGWINLGSGMPKNGMHYGNIDGSDAGVNHDGAGKLRGLAWSGNVGWLNFEDIGDPRIDLLTGRLIGFVWSANVGWLSMSNSVASVEIDTISTGPDTDEDGLSDIWELDKTGNLDTLTDKLVDSDGDGASDGDEYIADTDPKDVDDFLRVTGIRRDRMGMKLTWESKPTRVYSFEERDSLELPSWVDCGLGTIAADPSTETSSIIFTNTGDNIFHRVRVKAPLSP